MASAGAMNRKPTDSRLEVVVKNMFVILLCCDKKGFIGWRE